MNGEKPYRFVVGSGDEKHLAEINAMAELGYKVVQMIHDPAGVGHGQHIRVLMEFRKT